MKLTYWYCEHLTDSNCYSVRTKTRREALAITAKYYAPGDVAAPVKVTIEYDNALDLLTQCVGEGGLSEEALSTL